MSEKVKLSLLDKYLPVWIGLSMGFGIFLGYFAPNFSVWLDQIRIDTVSLPIALGLLWMMYPVLAKVKYEKLGEVTKDWKVFSFTLFINWVIAPFFMFGLAKLLLHNYPEYQIGLILVGIAPCIAMVLIWNLLAGGDNEKAAILVAINSIFQIFFYSIYAYFLISSSINITMWDVAKNVLFYLGIPLAAGFLTRIILTRVKGYEWYDQKFIKKLGPTALLGLLFTIVIMFAMQGEKIIAQPLDILLIAIPLTLFFIVMFALSFISSWLLKFKYKDTITIAFTGSSNNFELAIAVAVSVFGISSKQALATTVGPLVEVPILLGLVYLAKWLKNKMFKDEVISLEKMTQPTTTTKVDSE